MKDFEITCNFLETRDSFEKNISNMPNFFKETGNFQDLNEFAKNPLKGMPDFFEALPDYNGRTDLPVVKKTLENLQETNPQNIWREVKGFAKDGTTITRKWENDAGESVKAYFNDGKLEKVRQYNGNNILKNTWFDDNGTPYKQEVKQVDVRKVLSESIRPNTIIKKGNFQAVTDSLGRTKVAIMKDISLRPLDKERLPLNVHRDISYLKGDDRGHLIADSFGGPASKENVVAQDLHVNRGKMAQLENYVRDMKLANPESKIDLKVSPKYQGENFRPSSFSFKVFKDGAEQKLPKDIRSFQNLAPENMGILSGFGKFLNKAIPVAAIGAFAYSLKDEAIDFYNDKISGGDLAREAGKKGTELAAGTLGAAGGVLVAIAAGKVAGEVYDKVIPGNEKESHV